MRLRRGGSALRKCKPLGRAKWHCLLEDGLAESSLNAKALPIRMKATEIGQLGCRPDRLRLEVLWTLSSQPHPISRKGLHRTRARLRLALTNLALRTRPPS